MNAFGDLGPVIEPGVGEHLAEGSAAAELRVAHRPHHPADPGMTQRPGAHEAGLHRRVHGGARKAHVAGSPEGLSEREQLRVRGALAASAALSLNQP